MRRPIVVLSAITIALSGCYHVTVVTGAPEGPQKIDIPWQHSFIAGIVPPAELNTKDKCPQGVAKVETQHSFLNGLVAGITYQIYTPIQVTVTCASGPVKQ